MTTNKPEVVAYRYTASRSFGKRNRKWHYQESFPHAANREVAEIGQMEELIRLSDYEALQAEYEQLREHLQNMIDQTTPLEPVTGDPKWSRRIQLDEVIEERDSLRVEREKLRKDAERYQSMLSAVLREIPHRRGMCGNAPGHGHTVPGIWDEDNGSMSGKECAWCKIWNEAISAIQGGG